MEVVLRTNLKSKQLLILLQRIFSHPILLISQAAIFLFRFHFDLLNRSKLFKIRNEKKINSWCLETSEQTVATGCAGDNFTSWIAGYKSWQYTELMENYAQSLSSKNIFWLNLRFRLTLNKKKKVTSVGLQEGAFKCYVTNFHWFFPPIRFCWKFALTGKQSK